jgi:hypothetical protein
MAFQALREEAQKLRGEGKSISEIVSRLNASKSTVSYWCRDIILTRAQQRMLARRQRHAGAAGRLRAAELKRAERVMRSEKDAAQGVRDVGFLNQRDIYILGLALYWGEGYKSGNEECGLTNSDPMIILTFVRWLKSVYGISSKDLVLRVSINQTHRHRVSQVEQHWSRVTGIPLSQFTATSLIRSASRKIYRDTETHFGTLRVKVRKGTSLRRRILGSLNALNQQLR